jgi:hypothetical protein
MKPYCSNTYRYQAKRAPRCGCQMCAQKWAVSMFNPEAIMKAHQYLYYVKATPVWSDQRYDEYCKHHGLSGGGGSDLAESYPREIKAMAEGYLRAAQHYEKVAS